MKKVFFVVLCGLLLFGVTGCRSKENDNSRLTSKATIVNNEGNAETLTSNEIKKISDENESKFKKYYIGAKISFDAIVESIEVDSIMSDSSCNAGTIFQRSKSGLENVVESSKNDSRRCATINFKEGYKVDIPESGIIDITDISEGDKLHVESNIINMWNEQVECFGINENKEVDFDNTIIELVK